MAFALMISPALGDSINAIATGDPLGPPPLSWVLFCKEHQPWCSKLPATKPLEMTPELSALLSRVNVSINHAITYRSDTLKPRPVANRPGKVVMVESWDIDPAEGDCDDYSVSKLAHLIKAGLPRSALRIAIYRLPDGVYHSVLTVETTAGTMVLSNLSDRVMPWREVPHARWVGVERVTRFGYMGFGELRN
jgi:predicted transglutaminase-like cysteine proteinase